MDTSEQPNQLLRPSGKRIVLHNIRTQPVYKGISGHALNERTILLCIKDIYYHYHKVVPEIEKMRVGQDAPPAFILANLIKIINNSRARVEYNVCFNEEKGPVILKTRPIRLIDHQYFVLLKPFWEYQEKDPVLFLAITTILTYLNDIGCGNWLDFEDQFEENNLDYFPRDFRKIKKALKVSKECFGDIPLLIDIKRQLEESLLSLDANNGKHCLVQNILKICLRMTSTKLSLASFHQSYFAEDYIGLNFSFMLFWDEDEITDYIVEYLNDSASNLEIEYMVHENIIGKQQPNYKMMKKFSVDLAKVFNKLCDISISIHDELRNVDRPV